MRLSVSDMLGVEPVSPKRITEHQSLAMAAPPSVGWARRRPAFRSRNASGVGLAAPAGKFKRLPKGINDERRRHRGYAMIAYSNDAC